MTAMRQLAAITVLCLALAACASPAKPRPSFDEGVRAYDAGDYTTALQIWSALAEDYDLAAMRNLGLLFENGLGVPKNDGIAAQHYRDAAENGLVSAQLSLARLHANPSSDQHNPRFAYEWFVQAAISGSDLGAFQAARMMYFGEGTQVNQETALNVIRDLAENGLSQAKRWLEIHG